MKKLFLLLTLIPQLAFAGTEGGNGGDLVGNGGDGQVIEFRNLALDVAEKLQQLNSSCQTLIPLKPLELIKSAYRARIESSEEELTLRGKRVEAINYPSQNRIIFHFPSFVANKNQRQFVIHEFLGLLNLADSRGGEEYGLSKYLIELTERPECQSLVSKRRWTKKKIYGDTVYFQFSFPGELLSYNLASESQGPATPTPIASGNFALYQNEIFYGYPRQVCTATQQCIPGSQVPLLLHDFGFQNNRLFESIMGVSDAADFFETYYNFNNLQITNPATGDSFALKLETSQSNEDKGPGEKYRYSLARSFHEISPTQSLAIADQYSGDYVSAYSLVRFDFSDNPTGISDTSVFRNQDFVAIHVRHKKDFLRVHQRFFYPTSSSIPQEVFPAQGTRFLVTDEGSVLDTQNLARVALIEAPVEDVAQYGDYSVILSAGRILVYDEQWHLQGEFTPEVAPQGLAIKGDTISLFSMLTDQELFVEKHDINDLKKKQRRCFLSREEIENFKPTESLLIEGETYALAPGCVLKSENGKWQAWMGMQKNPAAAINVNNVLLVVDAKAAVHALDLKNRDETLIAKFNLDFVSAKRVDGLLELTLHHPNQAKDFFRQILLTPEGRIFGDRFFWKHHEEPRVLQKAEAL